MKLMASIIKSLKENLRNWKVLVMVLLFSPFFVLLTRLFYGSSGTLYKIGVLNYDNGISSINMIDTLKNYKNKDSSKIFKLTNVTNKNELNSKIKEKEIDIGIVIPKDYSQKLSAKTSEAPSTVHFYGSTSNLHYTLAAVIINHVINKQGLNSINATLPSSVSETFIEKKKPLSEFDEYVPGTIALAVLLILFTASASIVSESDTKTIIRLKLSNLGAFNFLAGSCIVQTIVAVVAIALSYSTALLLGYKALGRFETILIVGAISSLAMVAVSLLMSSFLNTIFDVLTIGCFPFFIMMFFSGSVYPLPKINLFTISNHTFGVTDILPLTHTVNAFNKILNNGADIYDVGFDIFMIALLTIIYFVIGLALYNNRKFSKA